MILIIRVCILVAIVSAVLARLNFKPDGTFKILHVSDVHYEMPYDKCADIYDFQQPCNHLNSSAFLSWLIETEKPDLVVHTGDIIDWATYPASKGMDQYYNVSFSHGVPWAASLGNHDDDSASMPRRESVLEYIMSLPGTLTERGPVENSYGNFILEIFPNENATAPALRTYHFDSDNRHDYSVQTTQVDWFKEESAKLNSISPAPALAFYHIPLPEYQTAIDSGLPISGEMHEAICYGPENTGLFDAFKDSADVKAGFCGHDHTNDFCVLKDGVQLCYEGSPGYQCYGLDSFPRRARVTEVRGFGQSIVSWKRLDTSTGGGIAVDEEALWSVDGNVSPGTVRRSLSKDYVARLPRREQKRNHD